MKQILLLFASILILTSCKTSTSTVETVTKIDTIFKERIIRDTIKQIVTVTKTEPTETEIRFNPCDSLGSVKSTNIKVKLGNNMLFLKDSLGELILRGYIDSSRDSVASYYKSHFEIEKEKIVSKYEKLISKKKVVSVWSKWTYIFLGISILLLAILFSRFKKIFPNIFF